MKRVVFGGFCMVTSVIGILAMILVMLNGSKLLGSINGSSNMFTYLNWFGITYLYIAFLLLGIIGFIVGLWGVFDKQRS